MKRIVIIRHAKSSWTDFSLSDFDRPLDERGKANGPEMAKRLDTYGFTPDKIVSSNAQRAKSTAQYFADHYNKTVELAPNLYHGFPNDYLDVVSVTDESVNNLILVGHNPGITFLANMISEGCTSNIPTCGIIVGSIGDIPWSKVGYSDINLDTLMFPKDGDDD